MKKKVKITVDAAVFEYSSNIWKILAGIDPSKVTLRLSKGQGVPNKECAAIFYFVDSIYSLTPVHRHLKKRKSLNFTVNPIAKLFFYQYLLVFSPFSAGKGLEFVKSRDCFCTI